MIWPSASTTMLLLFAITVASDAKPRIGLRQKRDLEVFSNKGIGQCPKDKYHCDQGKKCISLTGICDGVSDCEDKRDERNCISTTRNSKVNNMSQQDLADTLKAVDMARKRAEAAQRSNTSEACPKGTYSCDEGAKCVLLTSLCDNTADCKDQSDERNCPLVSPECGSQRFHCDGGAKCLPLTWLCDSIEDCNDKRDEHNCPAREAGKSLARAAEEAAITAAQEAKRAAIVAQELMSKAQQAADKAQKALQIAEASRH